MTDIIEVRIGYDGIVFASQIDGPAYTAFQPADIFNALGSKVLVDGAIVDNPHSQWADFQRRPASGRHLGLHPRHQARHTRSFRGQSAAGRAVKHWRNGSDDGLWHVRR